MVRARAVSSGKTWCLGERGGGSLSTRLERGHGQENDERTEGCCGSGQQGTSRASVVAGRQEFGRGVWSLQRRAHARLAREPPIAYHSRAYASVVGTQRKRWPPTEGLTVATGGEHTRSSSCLDVPDDTRGLRSCQERISGLGRAACQYQYVLMCGIEMRINFGSLEGCSTRGEADRELACSSSSWAPTHLWATSYRSIVQPAAELLVVDLRKPPGRPTRY